MVSKIYLCASVAVLLFSACDKKAKPKLNAEGVKANLLKEIPSLDQKVDANFGGFVIYLGNQVDTKVITPGASGQITHFWKVLAKPPKSWSIFTHLDGGSEQWMNIDASDMRDAYPLSKWKVGDIIRDEQQFRIQDNWLSKTMQMRVGLYHEKTHERMSVESGPVAKDNSVPVFDFSVKVGAAKATKEYVVHKTSEPMTMDGKADESAWKQIAKSPSFVAAEGGQPFPQATHARLLWDDDYLYAFIQVDDTDVFSSQTKHDGPLWKEDVVELFIDADKNRHGYVELQVNPNNVHLDAWFPRTRAQKHSFEWNANMKSAVVVHGSNDDRSDLDRGWDVEVAIPLASVKGDDPSMKVNIPPALGDSWRINVVRVETSKEGTLGAASWNPIPIQDFHALHRMFTIVFGDVDGATGQSKASDPGLHQGL